GRGHLHLAVDGDVRQVGRALHVDQDVDRLDRSCWEGDLVAGRRECRRREGVRRAVRNHVVAAEEEETGRRDDIEARGSALTLRRGREREGGGCERLPLEAGDVGSGGSVRRGRAVLLQMEHAVRERRHRTAGVTGVEHARHERRSSGPRKRESDQRRCDGDESFHDVPPELTAYNAYIPVVAPRKPVLGGGRKRPLPVAYSWRTEFAGGAARPDPRREPERLLIRPSTRPQEGRPSSADPDP